MPAYSDFYKGFSSAGNIIDVSASIDNTAVNAMVATFDKNIYRAQQLALSYIERAIRFEVLDIFVRALCVRAGPGWPQVYTDHLVAVIRNTVSRDITKYVGKDRMSLGLLADFNQVGSYQDFKKGAHFRALTLGDSPELHKSGKNHHGGNPHPGRVTLPYKGEPLLVPDEGRRQEFWERVVIDRDFSFELAWKRGKGNWTLQDHMDALGYEVASYEEVAMARAIAWGDKAPQWLLLENGSEEVFHGSKPAIKPVDFLRSIKLVSDCIASTIYEGAIQTLVELSESAGVAVGSTGIPYARTTGRFAPYKELLDINVADYSTCFGRV